MPYLSLVYDDFMITWYRNENEYMKPAHLRHGLSHAGELRMSECACFPQDIVQVWPMTHKPFGDQEAQQ